MLRRFAILVIAAAILVAAPSAAAQTGSPPGQEAGTVIVTATRLSDSAAALRACIARNCPPDQDIEASIAHAENLFVAGDYKGARTVLLKSRARNLRHADAYPQQFAGLLRANARIGAHLGDAATDRFDTIVAIDVLKRAYSAGDFNLLRARFDLGDFWLRKGEADNAMAIYRRIERDAVQQPLARGMALLRQLIVLDVVEQQQLGGARRSRIEPLLLNDPDPALAPFQAAARVL